MVDASKSSRLGGLWAAWERLMYGKRPETWTSAGRLVLMGVLAMVLLGRTVQWQSDQQPIRTLVTAYRDGNGAWSLEPRENPSGIVGIQLSVPASWGPGWMRVDHPTWTSEMAWLSTGPASVTREVTTVERIAAWKEAMAAPGAADTFESSRVFEAVREATALVNSGQVRYERGWFIGTLCRALLYLPVALFGAAAWAAVRQHVRSRELMSLESIIARADEGLCPVCDYRVQTLDRPRVCPECGAGVDSLRASAVETIRRKKLASDSPTAAPSARAVS